MEADQTIASDQINKTQIGEARGPPELVAGSSASAAQASDGPLRQRLTGGTVDHGSIGLEHRAVAGTIPGPVRVVPGHGAALVRATCRQGEDRRCRLAMRQSYRPRG
jgi:hypothetical protein